MSAVATRRSVPAARSAVTRTLIVIHRYLGVVIGLVMVLWCLSGFVMMYQGYPRLEEAERLRGLASLQLTVKEAAAASAAVATEQRPLSGFALEMQGHRPVLMLQLSTSPGAGALPAQRASIALTDGSDAGNIDAAAALDIAATFATGNGIGGRPRILGRVDFDQWTVEGARRTGPLYRMGFDDSSGTEIYIAERTGFVSQITTARTRFWSWLGAIPHWLYPTVLRQNATLWYQVVVWASLLGAFLTVIGVYIGVVHFRPLWPAQRRAAERWTPFRGWFYWHHLAGLAFGVLVLTWVTSGLFTMNPWGFLDTDVGYAERGQLAGTPPAAQVQQFLSVAPRAASARTVRLRSAPLNGQLYVMADTGDGSSHRLNPDGVAQPLATGEVRAAVSALQQRSGGAPPASVELLDHEDAYYYSGYDYAAKLPAYRVLLADAARTRYYIDADSGQLTVALDDVAREGRWLRTGLHDIDFTSALRRRPLWDAVVLLLLAGVTAVCVTGAWMSLKRVKRDVVTLRRKFRGRAERGLPGRPRKDEGDGS